MADPTSMGNGIMDDYVTTANINTVTNLNVSNQNIGNMTGIEDFTALTDLLCFQNQIITLDVSSNLSLINIYCFDNQLTTLDINSNTSLSILWCYENQLTTLDISNNLSLTSLGCFDNPLTSLDVSNNLALTLLDCRNNQLSTLNVSSNTSLTTLWCQTNLIITLDLSSNLVLNNFRCDANQLTSLNVQNSNNINFTLFNALNNPNLTCIEVDDATWSTANWANVDSWSSFSTNCANIETYVPDPNFENYLETHDSSGNIVAVGDATSMGNGIANDDYVTTARIDTVVDLFIGLLGISDLTGIEDFTALDRLVCSNNTLGTIDLSQNLNLSLLNCRNIGVSAIDLSYNVNLMSLNCSNNPLTSLDVSNNLALTSLYTNYNQIISMDVSANVLLTLFQCHDNQLTSLNVKNGNNSNFTSFLAMNNPNLTCIEVDNATYSTTNWTNIDATSTFVNNQTECNALSVDSEMIKNIYIYPNPAKNKLYIQTDAQIVNYKLFSVTGKLILNGKIKQAFQSIDISKLNKGIYFIKLEINNKHLTKKVIIE
jgi:hypothetical protein